MVEKTDTIKKSAPPSSSFGHIALTGSVLLAAAYALQLADTTFAPFIKSWRFEARMGLHHPAVPIVATVVYLAIITLLPPLMRNRQPMNLQNLMLFHNVILSSGSLACAYAILRELYHMYTPENGFENLMCDSNGTHPTSKLYFLYYIFYLSKMYEFLDTVILILRKKPLIFLHQYHHAITLWLCWAMLDDRMSIQWICTFANLVVHTFMYYFYACQSIGLDVWWKKYLTALQIWQFFMDEVGNASWVYFKSYVGLECSGSWSGFWFGVGVIASFFVLFIDFYRKSYSKKRIAKPQQNGEKASAIGVALTAEKEE